MDAAKIAPGHSHPLGATCLPDGTNFCVYAKHATQVELLLFDRADDTQAKQTILFDPAINRTYDYWHIFVEGITAGQIYGYRVTGPNDPSRGLRYDSQKLLVDPYAQAVANSDRYSRASASAKGDNTSTALKSVVVDFNDAYDWEGDRPLERPFFDSVIYELHVGGFTRNLNSGVAPAEQGTYAGLIAKIPYLVDLGIKTVELMPVQQFDAQAAPNGTNYWGYQPVAWFAPHAAYSSQRDVLAPVNEFRDLVKALHRADIEVVLDVVFNHTAEGDETGPNLSLRGFDNPTYYILDPENRSKYLDDTGCHNTINGNESVVRRMILDCLRHWVENYHVDGFRFDLAASLSRGEDGVPLARPPILCDIEADPVLAGTKIIAEAWDAAGLYQLANFGCDRWAVWNGQFRDHVRSFVKSDAGMVGILADNIVGSANLFQQRKRLPSRSVNYITAHDGFTLNDLVTYNDKHNEANGEQNRDGTDLNLSWNCGSEGPTNDPSVENLRQQQIKNFLTILLFSEGRPMLLMGDEVRRTQLGNNNAYCQDNPISWFNWDNLIHHSDLYRFTRGVIHFHQQSRIFRDSRFWGTPSASKITWHGQQLHQPRWSDDSRILAYELFHDDTGEHLHIVLNAYWEPLEFELPATAPDHLWCRLIDTAQNSPQDYCDPPLAVADQRSYRCQARSSVVFVSLPT